MACGRDRTLRLMHELNLVGNRRARFKPMGTDSNHLFGYHPNLLRERGQPGHRDQIWVAEHHVFIGGPQMVLSGNGDGSVHPPDHRLERIESQ